MISIHYENVTPLSIDLNKLTNWLDGAVSNESKSLGSITVVFGSDNWLLNYNVQYLNHDFFTDIITFDYSTNNLVSGDLLISIERIIDNASSLNVPRETETMRVIIHGVLHLCGYTDKTDVDKKIMREKEDYYLRLL